MEKEKLKEVIDNLKDENLILFLKKVLDKIRMERQLPLTKAELIQRAMESEEAIREGRVITIEELEREMKNW